MKERFIGLYHEHIRREGSAGLLDWMEKSDFFIAPASTRHHLSREGGLVEHSINVMERLQLLAEIESPNTSMESIAICGLLHDLCKTHYYTVEMRNVKEDGQWVQKPYYKVSDQLPYGHGEKSAYIIGGFMRLTREEAMAIRWHMGFSDESFKGGSSCISGAFEKYPLAVLLHIADLKATFLDEDRKEVA